MKNIKIFIFLFSLFFSTNTTKENNYMIENNNEIIIFIHGTLPFIPSGIKDVFKILKQHNIEKSLYFKSLNYIHNDPYFQRDQAMQNEGLHSININLNDENNCSSMIARMYEEQYSWIENSSSKEHTTKRFYYTFGWNGALHITTRYESAKILYQQILNELDRLKKLNIHNPKIKIITYSHGGNVALNLAAVHTNTSEFLEKPIMIDELIMFACPVQKLTDYLIESPLFKKNYHFYSANDIIPIMDITTPDQWLSKQKFQSEHNKKLPKKLTQIEIRITQEFVPKKRNLKLPKIIDASIFTHQHFKPKYHCPNHTEFWYFQWGSPLSLYRKTFALYPMPIMVFTPSIIEAINDYPHKKEDIILNIAPKYHAGMISNTQEKEKYAFSFLNNHKFETLYNLMNGREKKLKLSIKEQLKHFYNALKQAKADYKKEHPKTSKIAFSYIDRIWKSFFT